MKLVTNFLIQKLATNSDLCHFDNALQKHLQHGSLKACLPVVAFLVVPQLIALIQFHVAVITRPRDIAIVRF